MNLVEPERTPIYTQPQFEKARRGARQTLRFLAQLKT
jgi:hypothetical protein